MAATSKNSAPPPRSSSSKSEDDPSSDEEQEVTQPTPSVANTSSKRTRSERDGDKSDSDSESEPESESDPEPLKENLKEPLKPSSPSSDDEDEDEDEGDEEEEPEGTEKKPKSPVKESASEPEPDKKKLKALASDQSKKSAGPFQRIWGQEDEIEFLKALVKYRASIGELPQDYTSFLATINGSISFPVTEKQISNKIRQMKYNYNQKLKKGPNAKFSKTHDKTVFEMCTKLFEGGSKVVKKKEAKREANDDVKMANCSGGAANGGMADFGDGNASSYSYLEWLIENVIREQSLRGISVEAVIAHLGKSRASDLEAKAKVVKIDAVKLQAREERLKAEALDVLADEMADD